MSHSKSCTHIKVTGVRCGSPALRGEQFCYFHQRMLRSVRFPSSRVLRSALLEDPESIQASLMEVVNGLLRGTLELKRGELILRALNTAVRNIRHVRFDLHQDEMIREIPNYPDQPLTDTRRAIRTLRRPPPSPHPRRSRPLPRSRPGRILRRPRQSPRSLQASTPRQCPRERNGTEAHLNPCRDGRIRPSRFCRDSFRGDPSSEGAKECSPPRKRWVNSGKKEPAPAGRKKTRRLDKPEPPDSRRRLSRHERRSWMRCCRRLILYISEIIKILAY